MVDVYSIYCLVKKKHNEKKKTLTEWPKRHKSRRLGHYQVVYGSTGVASGGCGECGVVVAILCPFFAVVIVGFIVVVVGGVCLGCTGGHQRSHVCDMLCPYLENSVALYIEY